MDRKTVIVLISLALALLFVSTIGSMYTGYSVKQDEITLKEYPFPFVKNNDYNRLFIVLPNSYTLDEYEAAQNIAKGLQLNRPLPPEIITESSLPAEETNL